ncbi:MAG: transporter substrate-binding domain-containing protein [Alphaproteobacteria bacterium]|nr:transporter substrate-binding domain-containing protein [Alphaproteobacteria bacterium]
MRRLSIARIIVAALSVCAAPFRLAATDLVVYTENYPPFNFTEPDGTVGGFSTEKVRQVLDAAGLSYEIRVVPWARAVNFVQTQHNALIYTLTRTPKREHVYDWLVPLSDTNYYLFVRREETREVTPEALAAGVFTASCVSGDLACELLTSAGIPVKNITPIMTAEDGDFRMVLAGRADIYISDLAANKRMRRRAGYDPRLTKPVMRLRGDGGFYLASGPQVPLEIRTRIKDAYKTLMESGQYEMVDLSSEFEESELPRSSQ